MRKYLIIFFILTVYQYYGYCKSINTTDSTKISRHSVFFELGGNAGIYSLNYDYCIPFNKYFKLALTIGTEYLNRNSSQALALIPQMNLLIGKRKLNAEIGFGLLTGIPQKKYDFEAYFEGRLGIRHQKPNGGFMWRIAFTPLLFISDEDPIIPYAGFSVGYTFKSKHKKTKHN